MKRAVEVVLSIAVLTIAAPLRAAAQPAGAPQAAAGPAFGVVLRPGDMVRINVWRNPELSGDIVVDVDSTLRHPLYREVRAAGRPTTEVIGLVRTVLRKYEVEPQFVLEPLFRVPVTGEVRTPNVYTLTPDVTVAQAVLMAGGPTDRARNQATLLRDGRRIAVDLRRAATASPALAVRPGDEIRVERRRGAAWLGVATALLSVGTSVALILQWTR